MTDIPLASEYVPLVQSRRKTTTVRAGRRPFKTGQHRIVSGPTAISVVVTKVQYKTVEELTDLDARADGFGSREELMAALRRFYPRLQDQDAVTVVHFHADDAHG
ncbi:MAG: hypothetical protein AMXMBFR53_07030 [Gemmatimonadota bacterium]